jgi:hypothetical protein
MKITKYNWTCGAPCTRKISATVREGKISASRTCAGCRRVWVLDVATGGVSSTQYRTARPPRWEGVSSTGTQGIAGTSEDLALCTVAGKYHACCHDHGQTVCADSWRMAKHRAQHTDEFCSVCCGDMPEGTAGDLGEMDQKWTIEDSPFFKRGA